MFITLILRERHASHFVNTVMLLSLEKKDCEPTSENYGPTQGVMRLDDRPTSCWMPFTKPFTSTTEGMVVLIRQEPMLAIINLRQYSGGELGLSQTMAGFGQALVLMLRWCKLGAD